tara:strand:- start:688 stop:945 length:258 start_codon:yes stop_codon:yes gene_type:complete
LPKIKPNDGGHKSFGVDIDPNKDLVHNTQKDGSCKAYYKGSKMKYDDYLSELESRYDKNSKGKDFKSRSIGLFSGVNFDENGNII